MESEAPTRTDGTLRSPRYLRICTLHGLPCDLRLPAWPKPFARPRQMTPSGVAAMRSPRPTTPRWGRPNTSRFILELGDRVLIPGAIGTIQEHHPGQTIWIEAASSN